MNGTVDAFPLFPQAEQLQCRIREVLAAGRPAAARPMLRVLHSLHAPAELLAELDARLLMASGELQEALGVLNQAVSASDGAAGLHACRAELLVRLDQPRAALADAAEAVLLARTSTEARALLGIVLLEAGLASEACCCLAEAVAADPSASSYRLAYAEALHRFGHSEQAAVVLEDGIVVRPRDLAICRAALMHAVRRGAFAEAARIGEAARTDWVVDASVLGLLAHALGGLGRHAEASRAYADASALDPGDPYVRHLAAAGGAVPAGPCAPPDYVRVVFDGYAERFDSHLVSLGYRVPGLVRAVLEGLHGLSGPVTDLGCGTGLLAITCDDLAGPWTGIDLSCAMLECARSRVLYERLVEGEITAVLADLPSAGLVLAGDVLCYFGTLEPVLGGMRRHLRPGGHAVFSLEETLDAPYAIGVHGRFKHSEAYVRAVAEQAGLDVLDIRRDVLRWDAGEPVAGLIVVARTA